MNTKFDTPKKTKKKPKSQAASCRATRTRETPRPSETVRAIPGARASATAFLMAGESLDLRGWCREVLGPAARDLQIRLSDTLTRDASMCVVATVPGLNYFSLAQVSISSVPQCRGRSAGASSALRHLERGGLVMCKHLTPTPVVALDPSELHGVRRQRELLRRLWLRRCGARCRVCWLCHRDAVERWGGCRCAHRHHRGRGLGGSGC